MAGRPDITSRSPRYLHVKIWKDTYCHLSNFFPINSENMHLWSFKCTATGLKNSSILLLLRVPFPIFMDKTNTKRSSIRKKKVKKL